MKKERQQHAAHTAALAAQMDGLKELLNTYETSNQRKDEVSPATQCDFNISVISNLTHVIERQRERLELMRTFTQWRMQHLEVKEESPPTLLLKHPFAHGSRIAEQHYRLYLKRKAWRAWHSIIETKWRERVERACRARAEEVCVQLSADYEAKIAQHVEALDKARAEIQRLHTERERFEESMKKAFMRGVCALNMEAMNMFHVGESRMEQGQYQLLHRLSRQMCFYGFGNFAPPRDESGCSTSVRFQPQPTTSGFSPVHFQSDSPPTHSDLSQVTPQPSAGAGLTRPSARVVTSGQQKAMKTITARITGRSDLGAKTGRVSGGNLQVMSVVPPMSSVIVERHHPVTKV
ncbi:hypothetical protein Z043_112016, partial [Scleropages formosus]